MAAKTTYPHFVDPQDVDFTLRASISHLIAKTLNVAGVDADSKGFGIRELKPQNRSWVLSRMAIEISHRPREYTPYNITTWVSDYGRAMSTRNFVLGCEGEVFGSATTQWSMIDFKTRKMVDLLKTTKLADHVVTTQKELFTMDKPKRVDYKGDGDAILTHHVVVSDIDMNQHVNSMKYLQWAIDTLSLDDIMNTTIKRLDINYLREALYDQNIQIHCEPVKNVRKFELRNEEGIACCRIQLNM